MIEANEYIEANYSKLERQTRYLVIDAFEAGKQSQQAKIDELEKKLDCCREENKAHLEKTDELQARVDDALNTLCKLQYSSGERIYGDVGSILKGD